MNIVLNEYDWAKDMIAQSSLGDKPFETLCRVAKYYISDGYKGKDLKILMNTFLLRCDPCASVPKWENTINLAVSRAQKYGLVMIDELVVTKPEIDIIKSLGTKQMQRLAFTLLCLSKYYDSINQNADHWVNTPDCDVMRMANINTSIRRQSLMYHSLNELGLVQFSKKVDNTNVRVCFTTPGEDAVRITDMRNLGFQYMMHIGESGYLVCQNCGITKKYDRRGAGRMPKYCAECATKIKIRQDVETIMSRRRAAK